MRHYFSHSAFVLLVTSFFVVNSMVGCAATSKSSIEIRGEPLPIDSAFRVVSSLKERESEIDSFKGLYQVKFRQQGERWGLRQVVVFQRPTSLRIETLPKTGAFALNVLVTRPGSALYLDNVEKRVVEGEELESFFRQFFKLPAGEKEMMSFFVGRVPTRYLDAPDLRIYEDGDSYILIKGDKEYVWRVSKSTLLVSDFEVRNRFSGELLFTVEYDTTQRHVLPSGTVVQIPGLYSLHDRNEDFEMKGTLQTVEIGKQVRTELFGISIPEGYSRDKGI